MIKIILFSLLSLFSPFTYASELAADCGIVQIQIEQLGGEKVLRGLGLGSIIDGCKKDESATDMGKMKRGSLYCRSGDQCASYEFTHPKDRNLYLASCRQVASCRSGYKDKCSINNDKVRGGVGRVNWTLYSYSGKIPPETKGEHCK